MGMYKLLNKTAVSHTYVTHVQLKKKKKRERIKCKSSSAHMFSNTRSWFEEVECCKTNVFTELGKNNFIRN